MKRLVILGSTGSIGTQTLQVVGHHAGQFQIVGLAAGRNIERLAQQVEAFQPEMVCVATAEDVELLRGILKQKGYKPPITMECAESGLTTLATHPDADTVVVGLVGFIGLVPTLKALESGKKVLTANKETFVTAGHLVQPYLSQVIPLDSEHSAIFQCLQGCANPQNEVRKLYLTASGGPFWTFSTEELQQVTVDQALKHPNWTMGNKITIDSATMMNKGLEVIEAHHLFELPLDRIEVVIHPQSIVHSAVAYQDGSIIAQLGQPDMRVPLQYGLSYPERWSAVSEDMHLDLATLGALDFRPADPERFRCLHLAQQVARQGGTAPVVLNAADELAVEAFLNGQIGFLDIAKHIEAMLKLHEQDWQAHPNLETIIATDGWARTLMPRLMQPQAVG